MQERLFILLRRVWLQNDEVYQPTAGNNYSPLFSLQKMLIVNYRTTSMPSEKCISFCSVNPPSLPFSFPLPLSLSAPLSIFLVYLLFCLLIYSQTIKIPYNYLTSIHFLSETSSGCATPGYKSSKRL